MSEWNHHTMIDMKSVTGLYRTKRFGFELAMGNQLIVRVAQFANYANSGFYSTTQMLAKFRVLPYQHET